MDFEERLGTISSGIDSLARRLKRLRKERDALLAALKWLRSGDGVPVDIDALIAKVEGKS